MSLVAIAFAAWAGQAAPVPSEKPVPYDGQLVYSGPSQPGWRIYPATVHKALADIQPTFAEALDDGARPQAILNYHLFISEKNRRRTLAKLRKAEIALNGPATDLVTTSIDGLELIFVRRSAGESRIFVLPPAQEKVTPSLCVIQLPAATRPAWLYAMPMSFDWCRRQSERYRFGVRKVRLNGGYAPRR